jgi:hypothetical protein
MKHPPMLMHVKIRREDGGFCLWLPLFLLLPLALVLLIALSPLILLAVIVLWLSGRGKRALVVTRIALRLLCSMPGLRVDITSDSDRVRISIS